MKNHRLVKLLCFNAILATACIILFSPGIVGLYPGAISSVKKILFFVVLAIVLALFLIVNYRLLDNQKPKVKMAESKDLKAPRDYIKMLQDYAYKTEFEKDIAVLIGQIQRLSPKQASLDVILEQNFDKSEMTYIKFKTTIDEVVGLFYDNTKRAINRIGVFDEAEFRKLRKNELALPKDSKQLKMEIYAEHIAYVKRMIKKNEDIITLLDNLILEISKLDDISSDAMENIQIIAEMKELIKNTKYYS